MRLKRSTSDNYRELILAAIIVVLLLINIIPFNNYFKDGISFVFTPVHFFGSNAGNSVNETFSVISSISQLRNDNSELKVQNAQLKSDNDSFVTLMEENKALRDELKLGAREPKLLEAKVMSHGGLGTNDVMIVNMGSKDGVKEGDVVRIGNIYIGIVGSVENRTSRVILANNSASFLEVFITSSANFDLTIDELKTAYSDDTTASKLFNGVAIGTSSGITIENISTNAEIQEGNVVIIHDKKVNDFLYLGRLSEIIDDPSASQKNAYVQHPFVFSDINFVFVEISDD